MESLPIGNAPKNGTAWLLKCKEQVQCVASINDSPFLSKCKQKSLLLTSGIGYCRKIGNGRNIRWGRATKWVYCARASQSRGPLWSGRILNNDIMQAVQALKRTRGDQAKIERVFETRVYRLLKSDLLALLQELHRQDECHLALKVFDVVRKEIWYKPDLSLYASVMMVQKRNNLMEKVDSVFEELKKEPLQPDTKAFTRMLATLLRMGLPHHAIETYELMKQTQCKMDQYTFAVLIKGLKRLRQPDLADAITKEYSEFLNDPMDLLKDTTQYIVIS
ncbi:hypothetical protein SUGI_0173360 [Cryptomeria japonica]|nr:hypothetical protein SUGI_0173360 [Cryptomeria japonica]